MQSEPIFISNTKVFSIERKGSYLTININGVSRAVQDLEHLGDPFSIITKGKVDYHNPFADTSEFEQLTNPIPIASTLEHYLREAHVDISTSKREGDFVQYVGVHAGNSLDIESNLKIGKEKKEFERGIIPCQFYLIHDNLKNIIF